MASRHLSRISTLQALFSSDILGDLSFEAITTSLQKNSASISRDDEDQPFTDTLIRGIASKRDEIDAVLERMAPQWPLPKIAPIDRNILRIGLFELLFGDTKSVPPKVALNEAIELAKTFGSESSSRFVNGVLGSVYKELGSPRREEAPKRKEKEFLAGVVVCAVEDDGVFVALVKDLFGKWTLPKVHLKEGELSDSAALRAAREELGLGTVSIQAPLAEHEYQAHDPKEANVVRRVGYFLAYAPKETLRVSHGHTVSDANWFHEDDFRELETYEDLRSIIESGIVAARNTGI
ncbi:MAG: transcription antitermination factor NusB [Patescibacteria group bacterium]